MSFFNRILNTNSTYPQMWKTLDSLDQIDQIRTDSHKKPVVIYKHSTHCGLSSIRRSKLIQSWEFEESHLDFYFLDLIGQRSISNAIEDVFNVRHESPQLLIVDKGEVIYHTSHHEVSVESIQMGLAKRLEA